MDIQNIINLNNNIYSTNNNILFNIIDKLENIVNDLNSNRNINQLLIKLKI